MKKAWRHQLFLVAALIVPSNAFLCTSRFAKTVLLSSSASSTSQMNIDEGARESEDISTCNDAMRRSFLAASTPFLFGLSSFAQPSFAGEVGARITKAVTTSDLGVSVRRSVVKGAQMMDKLDANWEKFSDENNLGSERLKQQERPKPREIPDPKPLNVGLAKKVLKCSDETFLECTGVSLDDLNSQIAKVDGLVRKSFERSGLELTGEMTSKQFNYFCYVHFKAFCDILIDNKLSFNRKQFESMLGDKLLSLFAPSASNTLDSLATKQQGLKPKSEDAMMNGISTGLSLTDDILNSLVANGIVAQFERNEIDSETLSDWTNDLSDIQLSIPLDGDITLGSQVLLQEQGFRVYPDFGRFAITSALQKSLAFPNQNVQSDEYYMDTNYNSDPDLFEVKQVLLNIVIDSS